MSAPSELQQELIRTFENTRRMWGELQVNFVETMRLEHHDGHYRIMFREAPGEDPVALPGFENMGSVRTAQLMMRAAETSAGIIIISLNDFMRHMGI